MQAIILAGGRGQRLRPITDYVPKPLAPLANIPMLEWQLRYLEKFGIADVVVCSGYKTEMISHFLERRRRGSAVVSAEDRPLGTAGAIKNASELIGGDEFVVLNGDVITDINLDSLQADSIAAVPLRTKFGVLDLSGDRVVRFGEKVSLPDTWMNAGIYRLGRGILDELPAEGDIERTTFPAWAGAGRLGVVRFPGARWYSVDSFKDMEECSRQVASIIG